FSRDWSSDVCSSDLGPHLPFDVQSTNAAVLSNLQNDRTLSVNTNDDAWTGSGTSHLHLTCPSSNSTLNKHIYHSCGNGNGFHWRSEERRVGKEYRCR